MFEVQVVVVVCFDDDTVSLRTSEEPGDFQDLVVVSVSDYEAVAAVADGFACVNAAAVDEDYAVSSPPWRLVIIIQDLRLWKERIQNRKMGMKKVGKCIPTLGKGAKRGLCIAIAS
jgi:hypothetical protein